jgi:hypothetical protein
MQPYLMTGIGQGDSPFWGKMRQGGQLYPHLAAEKKSGWYWGEKGLNEVHLHPKTRPAVFLRKYADGREVWAGTLRLKRAQADNGLVRLPYAVFEHPDPTLDHQILVGHAIMDGRFLLGRLLRVTGETAVIGLL